jgi:hypothetical protein
MPALRTYKLFVSHAWEYNDDYYRVVQMLNNAPYFGWRNLSVPEHDPVTARDTERLKAELRDQMRPANAFLILAGMYVAHSGWIEFEIDFSRRIGRPIIGIKPWGSERVPLAVQNAAKEMVGWNTSSIVDAVRRHALPEDE